MAICVHCIRPISICLEAILVSNGTHKGKDVLLIMTLRFLTSFQKSHPCTEQSQIFANMNRVKYTVVTLLFTFISFPRYLPWWCRGSGLHCGSEDSVSIPGIPSTCVGPLMARRLKTSSDIPVPESG